MMRWVRIFAATCAVLMLATIVSSSVVVGASGNPVLVRGKKAGPIKITKQQKTFGSLPLTKGHWLVMSKAVLAGMGGKNGAYLGVDCKLSLGTRSDRISAAPQRQNKDGSRVPVLLTTAGKLKGSGRAKLKCSADVGGAVKIRDIEMTAIKVGKLTTRSTLKPAVAPSGTSGSGKPVVISAKQSTASAVNGDGSWREVARVPISGGRWWIVAKGIAEQGGASDSYECRVSVNGAAGDVGFALGAPGTAGDTRPFSLQVASDVGVAGPAVIECRADADFRVRKVVINAIRVGTLTIDALPAVTSGSGKPRVISWVDSGPLAVPVAGKPQNILTSSLPDGKWLVFATASFKAGGIPDSTIRRVNCQLDFSGFKDNVELRYEDTVHRVGSMVMQVPTDTSGSPTVHLRCRRTPGGGSGEILDVTISALKLKKITAWKI